MLASAVVFGLTILRFVHQVAHTDAQFQSVGRHSVTLPAHVRRGIFRLDTSPHPSCTAQDDNGSPIAFERLHDHFTLNRWVAVATFDTGDGHVTFTCGNGPTLVSDLRIAVVPSGGDFARLGLVGIVVPVLLGGAGFLVELVAVILWFTRKPPPSTPAYAGAAPGPYPPGPPQPPAPPG
jgi:hypothetical protein